MRLDSGFRITIHNVIIAFCVMLSTVEAFVFRPSFHLGSSQQNLSRNRFLDALESSKRVIRGSSRLMAMRTNDKYRRNLELKWQIFATIDECDVEDLSTCGGACDLCQGSGFIDCGFCAGTGFCVIGITVIPSRGGIQNGCIVCDSNGEICCSLCKGSGYVAKWVSLLS